MNIKKNGCLAACAFFSMLTFAGDNEYESPRAAQARAEINKGVGFIDSEGLPGQVVCISKDAFQLGDARNWNGTATGAGAGMFYGKGRAVYLGHPAYLTGKWLADNKVFLKNAIAWLAGGKENPSVAVIANAAVENKIKELGFTVKNIASIKEAADAAVVVSITFTPETAEAYRAYVKRGGGLLGAGLGWGWKQITSRSSKQVSLAKDYGDNLVFGSMGAVMGDMGTPKPPQCNHFPIRNEYARGTHLLDALDILAADKVPSSEVWRQCVQTVALALTVTPETAIETFLKQYPSFAKMAEKRAAMSGEFSMQLQESFSTQAAGRTVQYRPYEPDTLYFDDSTLDAPRPLKGLYVGVSLVDIPAKIEEYAARHMIPGGEKDKRWKTDWLLLRRIEPGSKPVTLGWPDNPGAKREVTLTRPYYIGVYEITQKQWERVMSERRDCSFAGSECSDLRPVCSVSYIQVRGGESDGANWPSRGAAVGGGSFLDALRNRVDGRLLFDLPSEAEWEVAARSGSTNYWNDGSGLAPRTAEGYSRGGDKNLDRLGRYCQNGGELPNGKAAADNCGPENGPAPVGSYEPSLWGLYDMHGNVFEHCRDWFTGDDKDPALAGKDPAGPANPSQQNGRVRKRRVQKGGCYWNFLYGGVGSALPGGRRFGALVDPGTGHGATGFRVMVPAQLLDGSRVSSWQLRLGKEDVEDRAQLLTGINSLLCAGFPSPVACLDKNTFPLIAGKDQFGNQLIAAAAARVGRGRVVLFGEESLAADKNSQFFKNVTRWLQEGGRKLRICDFRGMDEASCKKLTEEVRAGLGLLAVGCAWKWCGEVEEKTGKIPSVGDYPGNSVLIPLGLAVLDGGVLHTSASGYAVRMPFRRGITVPDALAKRRSGVYADEHEESQVMKTLRDVAELRMAGSSKPGYAADSAVAAPAYPELKNGTRVRSGDGIVFLGDSITRLGGGKDGWIDMVLEGLGKSSVDNITAHRAGWDGQTSGDMLGRFESLISRPGVKWICISCGVNDVWGFDWQRGVMLPEYKRNVRRMLDLAAKKGVNVVLLTPTLVGENPDNARNQILHPYAEFIRSEAKKRNLLLADVNRAETEALKKLPKGVKHFTYDGVHPVAAGHELFARTVLKALGE